MTRLLYPRAGKGRVTLGGVVFTDGAAEADLGPHQSRYLEMLGATIVRPAEELDEHTVEQLHRMLHAGGFSAGSHLHKADLIRVLRGEEPTGDAGTPQTPAGDVETPPPGDDAAPTTNTPETSEQQRSEGDAETNEEGTAWQPSPPSTTSPTTTGSLSLQERRRQSSQAVSHEPPAGS